MSPRDEEKPLQPIASALGDSLERLQADGLSLVKERPADRQCRGCSVVLKPIQGRRGVWCEFRICNDCRDIENRREDVGHVDPGRQEIVVRDALPLRYRAFDFATLDRDHLNRSWLEKLERWEVQDGSVFVCGPVGPGKSAGAAALARKLIMGGVGVGWISEQRLMRRIREGYHQRGRLAVQEWATTVPVLFLDDLGAAARTDWERRVFEEILTDRYDDSRPIVSTSNYKLDDLEALYAGQFDERNDDPLRGEKIVDRLRQMVGPRQWTLEGPSRRRQ